MTSCQSVAARWVLAMLLQAVVFASLSHAASLVAPNVVTISPALVTAGQPNAASLKALGSDGFRAVIYLAPMTVMDAVREEAEIVRAQGLEFINIPIDFGEPTEAEFARFTETMERLKGQKVLVHCQVNMRASTFTFLYRVLTLHESPELAYEAVAKVWSPRGPWRQLVVAQLKKAGIAFDLY
ncbi:protein tyrosine phosphatase family protein [Caenimonas koreensis]|uniref:protein tyrosine phosphatase family protein n=1 Tax=Caenimonas koreensis TaxID=367474 RepID=UPI0037846702